MKDKNLAKQDYIEMVKKSWTWGRLTEEEKQTFLELADHPQTTDMLKGNYEARYNVISGVYYAFLCGLGYSKAPADWREPPRSRNYW